MTGPDLQNFLDHFSAHMDHTRTGARHTRSHVQPLLRDLSDLAKDRASLRRGTGGRGSPDLVSHLLSFRYSFKKWRDQMLTALSTHCISDIERGLIPEWTDKPAPQIAIVS
jgi:hypothetical protein